MVDSLVSPPNHRWKGVILVILAALFWSTGGVFIKAVSLDAFQTSAWRALVAAIFIFLLFRPTKIACDNITLLTSLIYAITLTLFVMATKWTTAANAILLQYTSPIYVLILAYCWLGEPVQRVQLVAVALCLGGITLFFMEQLSVAGQWGNVCALLSGVAFAVMTVTLRKRRHVAPTDMLLFGNLWVVLVGMSVVLYQALANQTVSTAFVLSLNDAWKIGFLGVFQIAIPYLLFAHAMRYMRALDAALIGMLEPLLNPLWVMFFVGEYPSMTAVMGGAIIIGAIALQNIIMMRQNGLHAE